MAKYIYPHVNITTKALKRRVPTPTESPATTLLAPFTCDRGPENELVPVDTIADFENLFGVLDYTKQDQRQILNIGKWLSSGGRVLACRLTADKIGKAKSIITPVSEPSENNNEPGIIFTKKGNTYTPELFKQTITKTSGNSFFDVYSFVWEAKYSGEYYNDLIVSVIQSKAGKNLFNVIVSTKDNVLLEKYSNLEISKFYKIENNSEYIGSINFGIIGKYTKTVLPASDVGPAEYTYSAYGSFTEDLPLDTDIFEQFNGKNLNIELLSDNGGKNVDDGWMTSDAGHEAFSEETTASNLSKTLVSVLKQPLETPFDVMIDCGYSAKIKKELIELFTGSDAASEAPLAEMNNFEPRRDAFLFLSTCVIGKAGTRTADCDYITIERKPEYVNIAVYDQYEKVIDLYSKYNGREVYVPTTYFIADLIPFNDITYGVQFPSAGLSRGVVKGATWIDKIPSNKEKQAHYENGINYIEKDDRGQYIMTQLTYTSDDTALKFVNNARALLKMKKELTRSSRRYLHEFNDRITRSNLLNSLNGYVSNWIQNRTLSYGAVNVLDYTDNDALTNEELLIQLDIKFANTIEIISIEFTVE